MNHTSSTGRSVSNPTEIPCTPILKLNPDILWLIITEVTEDFSTNDALTMTRRYSHVCRSWRLFALQAQALWGKLINFDDFRNSRAPWREEVLRRSGESLLWIKGSIHGTTAHATASIREFFFSILNNHWERIQRIEIYIGRHLDEEEARLNWGEIYRPAPHLQVFKVQPFSSAKALSSPVPLFSDDAPFLRIFDARQHFEFSPTAPWLYALRVVYLGEPLALSQILDSVRSMHLLESLTILWCSQVTHLPSPRIPIPGNQPLIHLPNLTRLCVSLGLPLMLCAMASIQVPPSCSLALRSSLMHTETIELTPTAHISLYKFAQNYFQFHRPSEIWVKSSVSNFLFADYFDPNAYDKPAPFFSLSMPSLMTLDTTELLFRAVSLPPLDLESIKHLHLSLNTRFPVEAVTSFLSSLLSIETITTNEHTLASLLDIQRRISDILFPCLRTLRIEELDDGEKQTIQLNDFMRLRREAGHPLEILNLPNYKVPGCPV